VGRPVSGSSEMKILVIDENEVVRRQLFWTLRKGHELHEAARREEAPGLLPTLNPEVVLLEPFSDQDPDETAGIALVKRMLELLPAPVILIITGAERKEAAASLLRLGVADVFDKPVNAEELRVVLSRIEHQRNLNTWAGPSPISAPPDPVPATATTSSPEEDSLGIIGVDPQIKRILEQLRRIAPTPISVLITGETGTGKEIFAQAVHRFSDRTSQRFVPLNCAVLTDTLVEDELFGHEKGAFTGAIERRKGKFEIAHRGSLFLDEIGELSLRMQTKFLRVLQEHVFERLGGNQPLDTDFRLICATHRNLREMTQSGEFREDLMYRINVVSFHIPPLRERRGDLKLLSEHFLVNYTRMFKRPREQSFSREVMRFMYDYPWPGNVRELKHFVERAVALSESRVIGPEVIPTTFDPETTGDAFVPGKGNLDTLVKKYKRQMVMEALRATGNNKIQTAQLLGISKSHLFKLIKQLGVPH